MPSDPKTPNLLLPLGELRSTRAGDLPEPLRRRYFVEDRGRDWRLFVDATVRTPAIEDRGRRLLSRRADPNAVRDMVRIAVHRGWRRVEARGARSFRREAWLAGRAAGLEVQGYRPTERDLQELDRRIAARTREDARLRTPQKSTRQQDPDGAQARLRLVETVVRARVPDPLAQARLMDRARARIADWLDRGARFDTWRTPPEQAQSRERRRAR